MSSVNEARVTIVLRSRDGEPLANLAPFLSIGATVQVGRFGALITAHYAGDQIEQAELLRSQLVLAEAALKCATTSSGDDHHPALRRVIDHIMTVALPVADRIKYSAVENGDDHETAEEAAGQAIRVAVMIKQALEKLLEPDLLTTETLVVAESMHIDDRVKMIGAEPAFLTVVFKLPSLNDAKPLIDLLPYGQKALGTEAEVHGFSAGNLMGVDPCEQ